jgi:hypothetical protein
MLQFRLLALLLLTLSLSPHAYSGAPLQKPAKVKQAAGYDRDYTLQATMLGYFGVDGTRNPVLQAKKGEVVRIKIVNGELMTHDIALEKLGIKSKVLVQKGDTASIVFKAVTNDTYFCSIPVLLYPRTPRCRYGWQV